VKFLIPSDAGVLMTCKEEEIQALAILAGRINMQCGGGLDGKGIGV